MENEDEKQMAKDSVAMSQYEIIFKQEFAAFVDLREELKTAKTNVKKRFLEKKLIKQRGRALGAGMKLAEYKQIQEKLEGREKDQ